MRKATGNFDGKLGATLATKLAVAGLGGVGGAMTEAARGARGASLLAAFEKAVMRLWPAFCHIDARRRPAEGGAGGVGEGERERKERCPVSWGVFQKLSCVGTIGARVALFGPSYS